MWCSEVASRCKVALAVSKDRASWDLASQYLAYTLAQADADAVEREEQDLACEDRAGARVTVQIFNSC